MSRFIILATFQGDTPSLRLDVRQQNAKVTEILAAEHVKGSIVEAYWTAGAHDYVLVSEFDSAERASACALAMRADMNAQTTVLTTLDIENTAIAVDSARPATGRAAHDRPATGRDA